MVTVITKSEFESSGFIETSENNYNKKFQIQQGLVNNQPIFQEISMDILVDPTAFDEEIGNYIEQRVNNQLTLIGYYHDIKDFNSQFAQ